MLDTTAIGSGPRSPRFPSTKFSVPTTPARLVERPKLLGMLDRGTDARLTLVVASPGAGKTVLLADWLRRRLERPAAWLSCDVADVDPVRFVAAIIESLRRVPNQEGFGDDARQLLSSDGVVSADVIAALADDLEQLERQQVLVIDDFHLTGEAGPDALALLVEHRPPTLQLVLATRLDPPLRLSRMRVHEELVELRDRDLSFSRDEAGELFWTFGVQLPAGDLDVVHERSEGWAAGLQMAAISIQGSPDPARAAGRVELHRRSVAGYFLDEVLYRQPSEVVKFMLATSVLDELSVAACTALCGEGSAALLRLLYSSNMFVTATDDETATYRYHQLIKEVLRAELHVRDPQGEQSWLKRAADHLAGTGHVGPAARNLIEAGEPDAAFRLLSERVVVDYATNPALGSTLDLDEVHPDLFAGAPEILVPLAADLLLRGAFERGSRALALAQQVSINPGQQPELALRLATVNSMYYGFTGELDESLAHQDLARQLADQTAGQDQWLATLDTWAMYCHTYLSNFTEARLMAMKVATADVAPRPVRDVMCRGVLSQAALAEGDLAQAGSLAAEALDAAHRLGFEDHYFAFTARRTLAQLALERHDLPTAAELTEGLLIMPLSGRPIFDYLAQLDRARVWAASGNFDEALASLPAARAALKSNHSVLSAQADELEARLRLALGQRGRARTAV
ncbi:MAG TPA: AAA family ATPase, partial [Acidimicrobiales bacterium]|nr:AAA family ATPase [Acidimicrobiales bacterium]